MSDIFTDLNMIVNNCPSCNLRVNRRAPERVWSLGLEMVSIICLSFGNVLWELEYALRSGARILKAACSCEMKQWLYDGNCRVKSKSN